jgi:negative regulator of sigma E activity
MENIPSDLRESLWRRQPSATERQELRTRPELELEARLTAALAKMTDAPVPSNFTTRLLAELDREEAQTVHSHRSWKWNFLLPRLAIATAVVLLAGLSVQQYQINSHRTALARNVAQLAASNPLPSVDALENLDAIQRMSQSTHADGELLADLQ